MNDPVLDRHLDNCKKLMILWRKFHDYLNDCIKGREFTAQDEADFLKLKSQIAILHDSFIESVEGNKLSTAQGMIDVVERCILLRQVVKMNPAEIKKMEIEWHESYLLLNETIGFVQEEIDRMAKISRISWETKKVADKVISKTTRVLTNRTFHFVVGSAAIIFAAIILPMMGVYDYKFMKSIPVLNKVYDAGSGLVRQFIAKDLEFDTWEDYNTPKWRTAMPDGYSAAQSFPNKEQAKAYMLMRAYPGKEPLNLLTEIKDSKHSDAEKYNKDGADVYLFFAMLNHTAEARTLAQKYDTWKSTNVQGTPLEQQENRFRAGNICNVFYVIYSDQPDKIEPVLPTLTKK